MKAKLGSEAGMQCKPNEFLLQLNTEGIKHSISVNETMQEYLTIEYK